MSQVPPVIKESTPTNDPIYAATIAAGSDAMTTRTVTVAVVTSAAVTSTAPTHDGCQRMFKRTDMRATDENNCRHRRPPFKMRLKDYTSESKTNVYSGSAFSHNTDCSPVPRFSSLGTRSICNIRLPSLDEFDQGVEVLARAHGGQALSWTPATSPYPNAACTPVLPHLLPSIQTYSSRAYSPQPYSPEEAYSPYSHANHFMLSHEGYPSSPPDDENGHINQKYTTEEGDFVIYAWHDKKLKWQRIKQDFAAMFGRTPERTVQGLQAWYYRMNKRVPLWDKDGRLIFENDDDLEPKHISIKCCERDSEYRSNTIFVGWGRDVA